MKAVIVDGTPGTGKTVVAKKIARLIHGVYVDANKLVKEKKLYVGYDKKFDSYIVDEKKFVRFFVDLIQRSKKRLVIDSHLSHLIPKKYVQLCIITTCNLKTLRQRLEKRKWKHVKIQENIDSEILEVCLQEARERKHQIKIIDTTKGLKKKDLHFSL